MVVMCEAAAEPMPVVTEIGAAGECAGRHRLDRLALGFSCQPLLLLRLQLAVHDNLLHAAGVQVHDA